MSTLPSPYDLTSPPLKLAAWARTLLFTSPTINPTSARPDSFWPCTSHSILSSPPSLSSESIWLADIPRSTMTLHPSTNPKEALWIIYKQTIPTETLDSGHSTLGWFLFSQQFWKHCWKYQPSSNRIYRIWIQLGSSHLWALPALCRCNW